MIFPRLSSKSLFCIFGSLLLSSCRFLDTVIVDKNKEINPDPKLLSEIKMNYATVTPVAIARSRFSGLIYIASRGNTKDIKIARTPDDAAKFGSIDIVDKYDLAKEVYIGNEYDDLINPVDILYGDVNERLYVLNSVHAKDAYIVNKNRFSEVNLVSADQVDNQEADSEANKYSCNLLSYRTTNGLDLLLDHIYTFPEVEIGKAVNCGNIVELSNGFILISNNYIKKTPKAANGASLALGRSNTEEEQVQDLETSAIYFINPKEQSNTAVPILKYSEIYNPDSLLDSSSNEESAANTKVTINGIGGLSVDDHTMLYIDLVLSYTGGTPKSPVNKIIRFSYSPYTDMENLFSDKSDVSATGIPNLWPKKMRIESKAFAYPTFFILFTDKDKDSLSTQCSLYKFKAYVSTTEAKDYKASGAISYTSSMPAKSLCTGFIVNNNKALIIHDSYNYDSVPKIISLVSI